MFVFLARANVVVSTNNGDVLLLITSFTIGTIYDTTLRNQVVKYSQMVGLNVNATESTLEYFIFILISFVIILVVLQNIFQLLLLFLKIIFIVVIDVILNILYLRQQYQNIKQWMATMCCPDLSCKDHFFSNWIKMFKLYLQHLQMFKTAKMILNGIIFIICTILVVYIVMNVVILLRYTFLNDLLFYFSGLFPFQEQLLLEDVSALNVFPSAVSTLQAPCKNSLINDEKYIITFKSIYNLLRDVLKQRYIINGHKANNTKEEKRTDEKSKQLASTVLNRNNIIMLDVALSGALFCFDSFCFFFCFMYVFLCCFGFFSFFVF